jgi:hypothetical protein
MNTKAYFIVCHIFFSNALVNEVCANAGGQHGIHFNRGRFRCAVAVVMAQRIVALTATTRHLYLPSVTAEHRKVGRADQSTL